METRKMGSFVIGARAVCIGVLLSSWHLPTVSAQDGYPQAASKPAGQVVVAQGVGRTGVPTIPRPLAGPAQFVAIPQEVVEPTGELVGVVWPEHRLSFEQLRRILPYGTEHNLVIRYLTEDPVYPTQDD